MAFKGGDLLLVSSHRNQKRATTHHEDIIEPRGPGENFKWYQV